MPLVKAGMLYFALVFAAGFMLGAVRTLWIVPRVGTRMAELMETPIMLVVSILAARWTVCDSLCRPCRLPASGWGRRALPHAGRGIRARALASGSVDLRVFRHPRSFVRHGYYVALGLFAIMPLLVARR